MTSIANVVNELLKTIRDETEKVRPTNEEELLRHNYQRIFGISYESVERQEYELQRV